MESNSFLFLAVLLSLFCSLSIASDPSPIQDFCVADTSSSGFMNGFACMDASKAKEEHFFFSGLDKAGNTSNKIGIGFTPVSVTQVPGLNTLGISIARRDFAPWGVVPPHTHPRATEIILVLQGTIKVGFVTSNPNNKLFSKVLQKGDVYVFPEGLVHYMSNVGDRNAVSISALSSQNPGINLIPDVVFGSNPPISSGLLAKSFQIDQNMVDYLQNAF